MSAPSQKNIEQYLQDYNIDDNDLEAKFLQQITRTIHDRNDLVIEYEKTDDEYKQEQIKADIQELEQKIEEKLKEFKQNNN